MKIALGILILTFLSGCGSLQQVDRSRLNHPAMDLTTNRTPEQSSLLTTLGSLKDSSGGGACSVCAH